MEKNDNSKLFRNTCILILAAVLCSCTPLFYSCGHVIIILTLIYLESHHIYKIAIDDAIALIILVLSGSIIVLLTYLQNRYVYSKMVLVQCAVCILFYSLTCKTELKIKTNNKYYRIIIKAIYILFYVLVFQEIQKVLSMYGLTEAPRSYRYMFNWHYIDWSVVMIFLFMFGIKIKAYLLTSIMTFITIIVLPARMYKMYIILFILCFLFQKIFGLDGIKDIIKKRRSYFFTLIISILIFSCVLSFVWVYYVIDNYEVQTVHTGLNDQSNAERFQFTIVTIIRLINRYLPGENFTFDNMKIDLDDVYPHNSYLQMLLEYGFIYSFIYWGVLGKIFDKLSSRINDSLLLPYLVCAAILHNMLESWRIFFVLTILYLPIISTYNIRKKIHSVCYSLIHYNKG